MRPILEYGCQVRNPYLVNSKHINSIESIQRQATRVICESDKEYQERLGVLKLHSLELRRKFISLVQKYKIIFEHCDIDPHVCFFYFNVLAKTRRNHNFMTRPKKTRTDYYKFSFFNRYITDWNSIQSNIMHASSLSSFKSYLLDHLCQLYRIFFEWEFSFPQLFSGHAFFLYISLVISCLCGLFLLYIYKHDKALLNLNCTLTPTRLLNFKLLYKPVRIEKLTRII